MKLIPLDGVHGKGKFLSCDDEDFELLSKFKWRPWKNKNGKCVITASAIPSRLVLSVLDQSVFVDHKNGDVFNCQKENLRKCTVAQNNCNKAKQKTSKGGKIPSSVYKGVGRSDKKWHAQIMINRKNIYLGRFDSETKAAQAYNDAALKYHGEFARLNVL